MIDLNDYFNPVSIDSPVLTNISTQSGFPHNITVHTENQPLKDISRFPVAILGVPDGRNSSDPGSQKAPDAIRSQLYSLSRVPGKAKLIDLGNMKQGASFNDTIAGLTDILVRLVGENILPVIIGGSSALIPAIDRALSIMKTQYKLLNVDSRIDYCTDRKCPDSSNYLNHIVNNQKSTFEHYINIGYQTYLNDQQVLNRFHRKQAELIRIGDVRQAIHLTEPCFRDSEVTLFDISAVRQSDAPGTFRPSPNGFYGEEICLLARYAGISDNLKIFGLFDVNPELDVRMQTSALAAQILWFFLEGFAQKQLETPALYGNNTGRFVKYHVRITDLDEDMVFVKSNFTDRWWIEIPAGESGNIYVACSHDDYLKANRNEVPDRWINATNRIKS